MILLPRPRVSRKMGIFSALAKDLQIRAMNQWNNGVQLLYNYYIGIHQAFKTSRSPVSFLGIVSVCVYFHEHWLNVSPGFLKQTEPGIDTSIYSSLSPQFLVPDHLNLGGGAPKTTQPTTNQKQHNNQPPTSQPTTNQEHHPYQSF